MEKEIIQIRRIKDGRIIETEDEAALEYQLDITLRSGEQIPVACTPTHVEELILGRRFLLGDLSEEELAEYGQYTKQLAHIKAQADREEKYLTSVNLENIFRIAREEFENPQTLFSTTGCAHSCALVYQEKVVCCIEDIGRHNALDKVIGYALKHRIPIAESFVFSSGRISQDYLEKVLTAGFRMVVSRAAVTRSAVALAKQENITMLGFIRKNSGNIYHEGKVSLG